MKARLFAVLAIAFAAAATAHSETSSPKALSQAGPAAQQRTAVTMYATDWCPYCRQAREYFRRNDIPYTEHDIEKSSAARAEFKAKGGRGVPLILVGEQRMSGFSERRLSQMLKAAGY